MAGIEGVSGIEPDFRWAVAMGLVPGVSPIVVLAKALGLNIASAPITIGCNNTLQQFATAAESWEIVSSSASDTAAGTGARTVLVQTLDENFNPQQDIITLTGVVPVPLPRGAHYLRHQLSAVVSAGSGGANAGLLTIQVAGGGAPRGYMAANNSVSKQASYTVPAGCLGWVTDLTTIVGQPGGTVASAAVTTYIRNPNGVVSVAADFTEVEGAVEIHVPPGVILQERCTVEARVNSVSANGTDIALIGAGLLTNKTLLD
jgi:hypothetical protein